MPYTPPTTTKIVTSTPVVWSDGSLFSGYLLLGLALPTDSLGAQWGQLNLYGTSQRLPEWTVIPIVSGVVDSNTTVYPVTQIDPPNCRYAVYWYDNTWKLIYPFPSGTLPALISIPAGATYTLTQPTLTAPSVPTGSLTPAPQTTPDDTSDPMTYAIPVEYTLTGTANGTNTVFTIPVTPKVFCAVFTDGQKQETDTYTRSGAVVTFDTAPAVDSIISALVI